MEGCAVTKIAIFRPLWARNNTAFEVQAKMYRYLQDNFPVSITIFADERNHFQFDGLNVISISAVSVGSQRVNVSTKHVDLNSPFKNSRL